MNTTCKTALLFLLTVTFSFGARWKVAPDLSKVPANKTVDIIVRYRTQPQDRHHQLLERRGGKFKRNLAALRSAAYSSTPAALQDRATSGCGVCRSRPPRSSDP